MSGKLRPPRSGGHLGSGNALLVARGLPADVLRQASRRLELASLVAAAAYSFVLVLSNALHAAGWRPQPHLFLHNLIGVTLISVSMALFWLCRRGRLPPIRLLDLGLLYEVVVALGISLQDNLAPLSPDRPLDSVSWLCIWIVMFPLIVPAPPAKAFVASLAAASTWPVAFFVGQSLGHGHPAPHIVALNSPHTIELYDFGVTAEGTFYYVMEILHGLDLETLVRQFGPVPAERAVHLLLQICDSLADAHHAGLVHRDIKPANIYACKKGLKHDFVKVLDFGLVKSTWAEADDEISNLTQEGAVPGTPGYIAPEVALGDGPVDGRADLYAVGCVAYWLLTGHRVFEGDSPMQVALQHVQRPPVPPSRRTELPIGDGLERAILSCLEKAPERRPADAEGLARRISDCRPPACWGEQQARGWWEAHLPE